MREYFVAIALKLCFRLRFMENPGK